jgi:TFIIF-interacting CTD phosphatase-like protein
MIHCLDERDPEFEDPDVIIRIPLDDEGEYADAGINIRPHLYECLKSFNQYYQVIAFTASD